MNGIKSKLMTNWRKGLMIGLTMSIGMVLSACQTSEAGAVMAIEDEGGDHHRNVTKRILGGIVIAIRKSWASRNVSLRIRETRIGKDGGPLCDAPTGRTFRVESVAGIFVAHPGHLRSALVVMENPSDPTPGDLSVGDCVSIAPDDIDRVRPTVRSSIRIESPVQAEEARANLRKGVVELWANVSPPKSAVSLSWRRRGESRKVVAAHKASRAGSASLLRQPA